jgi:hypothetical protein
VLGNGSHGIVRNTRWNGTAHPSRVGEEGIQSTVATLNQFESANKHFAVQFSNHARNTYIIKVNICTAKVSKNKVSDSICPLDRVLVAVKCVEEPRIFVLDKLAGLFVGP